MDAITHVCASLPQSCYMLKASGSHMHMFLPLNSISALYFKCCKPKPYRSHKSKGNRILKGFEQGSQKGTGLKFFWLEKQKKQALRQLPGITLCAWVFFPHMCLCTTCICCVGSGLEEGIGFPRTGATNGYELPWECWNEPGSFAKAAGALSRLSSQQKNTFQR